MALRTPALAASPAAFCTYGLVATWQHIPEDDRWASLARLAGLLSDKGRLVLSLRHGPGHPSRPVIPIDSEATVETAQTLGMSLLRREDTQSLQATNIAAGVTWTWLVFEPEA